MRDPEPNPAHEAKGRRSWVRDLALVLLLAAAGWFAPVLAAHTARPALIKFGPNDADYVRGFRSDWERDGLTLFRWTGLSSSVTLPLRIQGEGHVLRMRVRRHFVEPARVSLSVEGRAVGSPFTIAAELHVPYRVIELPLPALQP